MNDYSQFECEILTKKPTDFKSKWASWLKEVHNVKNNIEIVSTTKTDYGKLIEFYFDSVKNTKIFAKLYLQEKPILPVVAYYHGHGSDLDDEWNNWHAMNLVNAGFSVCSIDMRFQKGKVIDNNEYKYTDYPSICYNITDLENSYNKRLDQDALKILDIITDYKLFPELKGLDLMVAGPSQGGGLSLMVSAMSDKDILCSLSDVPSDCAIKDRILGEYGKYTEITKFLKDHPELKELVLNNQDYFDVVNMAEYIKCPVITSVGGKDDACPARFFYQAYKKIPSQKELYVYDEYGHGGFEELHLPLKIEFSKRIFNEKHKK